MRPLLFLRPLFCLIIVSACSLTGSGSDRPALPEVVRQYFSTYEFQPSEGGGLLLEFHKKKDGWHVAELNGDGKYVREQHFWSSLWGKYLSLDHYRSRSANPAINIEQDVRSFYRGDEENMTYQYAHNIYYGYHGWDWDVISDYGDEDDLSELQLQGLANAYLSYAVGFFFGPSRGEVSNPQDSDRATVKADVPLSAARRDKFITYMTRSIETRSELYRQNPAYYSRVGNMKVELGNDQVHAWYNLKVAGYEKDAVSFLKPGIYPDSILRAARNYLKDAGKNAIIVTGGDNDTYPVWYVQQVERYRPDVTVINYSLLAIRRYLLSLNAQHGGSFFRTPPATYMDSSFDVALYGGGRDSCLEPLSLDDFLTHLNVFLPPSTGVPVDARYRLFSCRDIQAMVPPANPYVPGKKGAVRFKLRDLLLITDIMLLDILNANLSTRPLYFTHPSTSLIFKDKLTPLGTLYMLKMDE